jgi:hypothetical protein
MLKLRDSFTTETRLRVTLDQAIEIYAKAPNSDAKGPRRIGRARERTIALLRATARIMSSGKRSL